MFFCRVQRVGADFAERGRWANRSGRAGGRRKGFGRERRPRKKHLRTGTGSRRLHRTSRGTGPGTEDGAGTVGGAATSRSSDGLHLADRRPQTWQRADRHVGPWRGAGRRRGGEQRQGGRRDRSGCVGRQIGCRILWVGRRDVFRFRRAGSRACGRRSGTRLRQQWLGGDRQRRRDDRRHGKHGGLDTADGETTLDLLQPLGQRRRRRVQIGPDQADKGDFEGNTRIQ